MDDLPPVKVSPSLARRRALREADEAHQIRVTDAYPLSKYMGITQKLFTYFQDSFEQLNLDEAFVYGVRLVHLGLTHLPNHKEWKDNGKDEEYLRLQIGKVLSRLDIIKRRMDEEETAKIRARILAQQNNFYLQHQLAYKGGVAETGHGEDTTPKIKTKKNVRTKIKKIFGISTSNKGAVQSTTAIKPASGGIEPSDLRNAPPHYTIEAIPVVEEVTLKLKSAQSPSLSALRYAPESDQGNKPSEICREDDLLEICREEDEEKKRSRPVTPLSVEPVPVTQTSMTLSSTDRNVPYTTSNPNELKSAQNTDKGTFEESPDKNEEAKKQIYRQENQERQISTSADPYVMNRQASMSLQLENRDVFVTKSKSTDSIAQNSTAELIPSKHDADTTNSTTKINNYSEHTKLHSNTTRPPDLKDCLAVDYSKADLLEPYDHVVKELKKKIDKMHNGHHVIVESNCVDNVGSEPSDSNFCAKSKIDINDFFDTFAAIVSDIALRNKDFTLAEEETKVPMTKSDIHDINTSNIFAAFDSILSKMVPEASPVEEDINNGVSQEITVKEEAAGQGENFVDYAIEKEAVLENDKVDFEYCVSDVDSYQTYQLNESTKPANESIKTSFMKVVNINKFFSIFDEILSKTASIDGKRKTFTEAEEKTDGKVSPEFSVEQESADHNESHRDNIVEQETKIGDDNLCYEYTIIEGQSKRSLQTSERAESVNCSLVNITNNNIDRYASCYSIEEETVQDDDSCYEYTIAERQSNRNLQTNEQAKPENGSIEVNNINISNSFDEYEEEIVLDDESYFEYTVAESQTTQNFQTKKQTKAGNKTLASSAKNDINVDNSPAVSDVLKTDDGQDYQISIYRESQEMDFKEENVFKEEKAEDHDEEETVKEGSMYIEDIVAEGQNAKILQTNELAKPENGLTTKSTNNEINVNNTFAISDENISKTISKDKEEESLGEAFSNDITSREIAAKKEAAFEKEICKNFNIKKDIVLNGRADLDHSVVDDELVSVELSLPENGSKHVVTIPSFKPSPQFQRKKSFRKITSVKVRHSPDDNDDMTMITMDPFLASIEQKSTRSIKSTTLQSISEQGTSATRSSKNPNSIPEDNSNNRNSSSNMQPSRFQPRNRLRKITSVKVCNDYNDDDMTCVTMDPCLGVFDDKPELEEDVKDRIIYVLCKDLWKRDGQVVEEAVKDLHGLAHYYQAGCSALVLEYRGIAGIAQVMTRFSDDEEIQYLCCDTLCQLVPCEPELSTKIHEMEVDALISRSMSVHPESDRIQDAARATISMISYGQKKRIAHEMNNYD